MYRIENLPVSRLKEYENNPRNNDLAVDKVAASISRLGFLFPIVIDMNGVIVCGHTRKRACEQLGMKTVPCIRVDDLTPDQVDYFRLVDNRTSEYASWDYAKLESELKMIDLSVDANELLLETFDLSDFAGLEELEELPEPLHMESNNFMKPLLEGGPEPDAGEPATPEEYMASLEEEDEDADLPEEIPDGLPDGWGDVNISPDDPDMQPPPPPPAQQSAPPAPGTLEPPTPQRPLPGPQPQRGSAAEIRPVKPEVEFRPELPMDGKSNDSPNKKRQSDMLLFSVGRIRFAISSVEAGMLNDAYTLYLDSGTQDGFLTWLTGGAEND